jgi:hypothetical protein
MGSFFSDTFFKSFSSKYVYVEAASTTVAPSICTLSRIYSTMYNSFLNRSGSTITQVVGAGGGGGG